MVAAPSHLRVLFALPELPRRSVSARGLTHGREALSGTLGASLLVADLLASRGHDVGLYVRSGDVVTETRARHFGTLTSALDWVGDGRVILCSWDEPASLAELKQAGARPVLWLHVHVSRPLLRALEADEYEGLLVVSDTIRLSSLRSRARRRIGRVYNPVNPFFASPVAHTPGRYASGAVVCAGYFGQSKGVHRVLAMWPMIRAARPHAVLSIAGSSRLYNDGRTVGTLGLAEPAFEEEYLLPLVRAFGSLEAAGVRPLGLLSPEELRALYARSALGVVNLNWDNFTETFCCTGVEMLATQLPVFGVAAGGLPETVGPSGGAVLASTPDLKAAAQQVIGLLDRPERLAELGHKGRAYVLDRYSLERLGDEWERILRSPASRLADVTGRWLGRRGMRYRVEWTAGSLGLGWVLDSLGPWVRRKLVAAPGLSRVRDRGGLADCQNPAG